MVYVNVPLAFLQTILAVVLAIAAYKDREYVKLYYETGKTDKRVNYWTILLIVCAIGEVFGFIGQAFSFFAEYA